MIEKGVRIEEPRGKLGVLLVGLGAVSTTFIAGVEAVKRGLALPIGSLSQFGTVRLGKRTEGRSPKIADFVPLAQLEDLEFASWDVFDDDAYTAAVKAGVLEMSLLDQLRPVLEDVRPYPAVFDNRYVKRLDGTHVKKGRTKWDLAHQLMEQIRSFQREKQVDRMVMVWCGSTEVFLEQGPVHEDVSALEEGLKNNDPDIPSSMIYAYAALKLGIPYANGAPNLTVDAPAFQQLALDEGVPICGKDFKTGQTLMKTIVAPGLKARLLGLAGWFSTNILGNRDGEVLDDPGSFRTKEESKLSVLEYILQPSITPTCTATSTTRCGSTITRRAGTTRRDGTTWTSSVGWDIRCRSRSTSFARTASWPLPSCWTWFCSWDLAKRAGMSGIQEWLSFYFKSPMTLPSSTPSTISSSSS